MQDIRPDNLITTAQMLWASFSVRIAGAGFESAIQSGSIASQLMSHTRLNQTLALMIPTLSLSLMAVNRIQEAVETLQTLRADASKEDSGDLVTGCWYYCCSLDLILYAGVRLENVDDCVMFAKEATTKQAFGGDQPLPLFCLAASICVWFQRTDNQGRLRDWIDVAADCEPKTYDEFLSIVGFLKLVECKLIDLSRTIGAARSSGAAADRTTVERQFDSVARDLRHYERRMDRFVVLKPRLLHLRAYLWALRGSRSNSRSDLEDCIALAALVENVLEGQWAARNHVHWFKSESVNYAAFFPPMSSTPASARPDPDRNFWKEHCSAGFPRWSEKRPDCVNEAQKCPLPLPENCFVELPSILRSARTLFAPSSRVAPAAVPEVPTITVDEPAKEKEELVVEHKEKQERLVVEHPVTPSKEQLRREQ